MSPNQNSRGRGDGLKFLWPVSLVVIFNLCAGGSAQGNLVINATFDSTITSDPNAATIEGTINSVIALYQASFSDPVTMAITFHETSSGLGFSSTYYNVGISYSSIHAKLVAGATTVNDTKALAHLPNTTANPANGSTTMELTLPNGRALGFSGSDWNPSTGQPDGDIYLNTSLMNLTRKSINPSKYDLFAVAAHEVDEVLGLSSALDNLNNGDPAPTGDVDSMDLFRYDQNGNRSFNTTLSSQAWFSLDGKTQLVRYNQDARRRAFRTPSARQTTRPTRRWNSLAWTSSATISWCPPSPSPRRAPARKPSLGRPTRRDLPSRRIPISCPPTG